MGHRTLVLGAYHYCWYGKCRYFKECVVEGRVADYDTVCPEYERMSYRDYYRLSNSNIIEIDSYLEGEHYPAYDRWEPVFMQDLPAFEDVLRELRPQAVLVWTEPLRQFLDRHCASLEGISLVRTGVIEMEALEAWEYRVGYAGEPARPVRRNKAQFRTFRAIVRMSPISLKLCTEDSVSNLAMILKDAYGHGLIEVVERSDRSRAIVCVGEDEDIVRLIDNILRKVAAGSGKRGLTIDDIQQFLGTDIRHVPQMLYRLNRL